MVANDEGGGETTKWWFTTGGGVIDFHINDPTNGPLFLVNAAFSPDPQAWYHLALTKSNQVYVIYVNGAPVGSTTNSRAIPNANASLTIGNVEGFQFNGQLDEVTIYKCALSGSEISTI
jgi:hypothetical protein